MEFQKTNAKESEDRKHTQNQIVNFIKLKEKCFSAITLYSVIISSKSKELTKKQTTLQKMKLIKKNKLEMYHNRLNPMILRILNYNKHRKYLDLMYKKKRVFLISKNT